MSIPILASKISLPLLRPNLTPRPRLLQRLSAELWQPGGFTRYLTLVTAPAGYGKTTLVVEWLRGAKQPVAWLSLDENDNDPARFLAYLIAALEGIESGIGKKLRKLQHSPGLPPERLLTALVNELDTLPTPSILALDDMQLVQAPVIFQQLNFLLEHPTPKLHLVILSREDPPLPISRLRARGEMVEIRQFDLCFTLGETREFIHRTAGLELPPEALQMLAERTEGWAVGLQLAALALQETIPAQGLKGIQSFVEAFAGSRRYILDYLFEEVLAQQPQEAQDFLLKTSILERMSVPLCAAVAFEGESGDAKSHPILDSQKMLARLEHYNLFLIPLDSQREWYRYHPLFRELLRHRLRLTEDISEPVLHERASRWFDRNGFPEEAVQLALSAQNWGMAAALLGQVSGALLMRGEFVTLTGWFKRLPQELVRSQPELCLAYGWALLLVGQLDEAEALLECAQTVTTVQPVMMGKIAAAKAYLAQVRGDGLKLIEESERALALLPASFETDRGLVALSLGMAYWNIGHLAEAEHALHEALDNARRTGNDYAAASALIFLARCQATRGKLRLAEKSYLGILESGLQVSILSVAHLDLGAIYLERHDFARADEQLKQGLGIAQGSGNTEFQIAGLILQGYFKFLQGDVSGASIPINQALQIDAARHAPQRITQRLAALQIEMALATGDTESASRLGGDLPGDADWHPFYRFLGLTKARLMLAQGQKSEAARTLQACFTAASEAGWGFALIAVRVLQTLCAETTGTALEFLTDALRLGEPEGFIRTFVEAGEPLTPLLIEAAQHGIFPEYAGQILSAAGKGPKRGLLVESLSERELEVLRLVAAGLSNRQIAEVLVVSLGTTKTHIHNICGKLGVHNRTEAAMKAKELKLV